MGAHIQPDYKRIFIVKILSERQLVKKDKKMIKTGLKKRVVDAAGAMLKFVLMN